jgi:hypothetical protein
VQRAGSRKCRQDGPHHIGFPAPDIPEQIQRIWGVAFFQSKDPLLLPWTTTKRGLNGESAVYQLARNKMAGAAGPFLKFLSGTYPSGLQERPQQRVLSENLKPADLTSLVIREPATFAGLKPAKRPKKTTTRIIYDADIQLVERIKKHLRRPSMLNSDVGRHTFDHFIRRECPERRSLKVTRKFRTMFGLLGRSSVG